jgi:stearoyl-CoA desaturase (delta-9 desaturase)
MFTSETSFKYVVKILRDPFHVFVHRHYAYIHGFIFLTFLILGGVHATALYYLAPAAVLWNLGSLVNTLCHSRFGYRNHELSDDLSKNNFILGFLVWGEGWHNNHHKFPIRAKYGEKWWEVDISYLIIKLIRSK